MDGSHRPKIGPRRGFSLLEIQAAFIVLGFSMAALVPFAVAQLKLVGYLEKRLPPNTTYVLMSRDHGLVSLLAAGGGEAQQQSIQPPVGGALSSTTSTPSSGTSPNTLTVEPPHSNVGLDMSVTVTVKQVP